MPQEFTKYEIARIIGARALQIAMDAPILVKITKEQLKEMDYDALKIAEYELTEKVLPIDIIRPTPQKKKDKLSSLREDTVSDEELIAQAQEIEREITQEAKEFGFVNESEDEEVVETVSETPEEQ